MKYTQTVTLEITYDPKHSNEPSAWDWQKLLELNKKAGETVQLVNSSLPRVTEGRIG